jgi:hypothetical protein
MHYLYKWKHTGEVISICIFSFRNYKTDLVDIVSECLVCKMFSDEFQFGLFRSSIATTPYTKLKSNSMDFLLKKCSPMSSGLCDIYIYIYIYKTK